MRSYLVVLVALCLAAPLRADVLPAAEPKGGALEKVASPDDKLVVYQLFERGKPTFVGVAAKTGEIVWQKNAGLRPLISTFWAADSSAVLVLTDCFQPEAELKSQDKTTSSWLLVLDAKDGHLLAQGDLDRDVLELATKLPDAMGAAHVVDKLTLAGGTLEAAIKHRGQPVSGSCPLAKLAKPAGR